MEFRNNTASTEGQGYGGAAFLSDYSTLNGSGRVTFAFNQALAGAGGALFLQERAAVAVSGSVVFYENQAHLIVRARGSRHTLAR